MRIIIMLTVVILTLFMTQTVQAASEKKEEGAGGAMEHVKMDPLILPVIDQDGLSQVLSVVVVIEVEGVFNADKVKAKSPRLKDAYIQDMYGVLNEHAAMKNGIVQVNIIKERLNTITDDILGDEINADVLLQAVQQRPI